MRQWPQWLKEAVPEANDALRSMRDKGARWWNFDVSHTTFNLLVGDPPGNDNIVLCLPGCRHLSGPVEWPNQQIEIELTEDATVIHDRSVGFRGEGSQLKWRRNYDVLSFHGIWNGRGSGPKPSLGIDDITKRLGEELKQYYAGEIGFAELAYRMNAVLWYELPAAGTRAEV